MTSRFGLPGLSILALGLLTGQSCVTVTNNPGGGSDEPPADGILLRFVNQTGRAVDVQFYATGQPVFNTDTDLFIPPNQVTANIGFAGSGLLEAGATDSVPLTCANAAVVGTIGGRFLDPNTGEEIGFGRRLVLFEGLQYSCGNVVTFTYTESGGTFSTGLSVR